MEAQRTTTPAPQRSSTHETHGTRHADKTAKAGKASKDSAEDDGSAAEAAGTSGFSQLLAALGMGADALADPLGTAASGADAALGQTPLQLIPGALSGLDAMWARGQGKAGMVDSLVGQTARLDGAADAATVNGTAQGKATVSMRGGAAGRFPAAWAGAAGAAGDAGATAAGAGAGAAAGDASGLKGVASEHGKASSAQGALAALAAGGATATAGAQPEHRDTAALAGAATAQRSPVESAQPSAIPQALAALAPNAAQADGRAAGRGGDGAAQGNAAAAVVQQSDAARDTLGASAFSADLSGAAGADAAQRAAEDQIAEQVAYWVHQKTQNAELTLDRDGQPVQVTVSLTGSEAHVAFRSDQHQTRELLDGGVAQLRELLQAEGLQLSGVTVGSSGGSSGGDGRSGGSEGGGGRGRQGVRQASVQAAAPLAAGMRGRGGAASSLDVFV